MKWDWSKILESLPDNKREYFETLHIEAELHPEIPRTKREAIEFPFSQLDSVFLKAYEPEYNDLRYKFFENRLKLLKRKLEPYSNYAETIKVYFTGTNMYIQILGGETMYGPSIPFRVYTESGDIKVINSL